MADCLLARDRGVQQGDVCGDRQQRVRVRVFCARLWCGVKRRGILQRITALCGRLPTCTLGVQETSTKNSARVSQAACSDICRYGASTT